MNRSRVLSWRVGRLLSCAIALSLMISGSAFAQSQSGNVFGTVVDNQGAAIPGVTVTLTGPGAPGVFITDLEGKFRFLNLSPGRYSVRAELSDFGKVVRDNLDVNIGRNSEVTLTLSPTLAETITITAETPLLDVRKTGTGATVTKVELEEVPTARDPWVILQQVPGVLMDRINIGGNESGQQSQFVSKGATGDQATFNVDGVNITDMAATGSSPAYYDFDSFEEMQVTTGGTDPRIQTPGVQLNMVTKRGSNELRGSGRFFWTDGEYQDDPKIPAEAQPYLAAANEIDNITDQGFEVGGPILRDRIWAWGAFSDNQIDLFTAQNRSPSGAVAARYSDRTTLETINFKLNAQITSSNSFAGIWTDSGKIKFGRNVSPSRPPASAWNQDAYGPPGIWKIEDTQIFSSNFYLTGMYSKVNGGFQLMPDGGVRCVDPTCAKGLSPAYLDLASGQWGNSFVYYYTERPQDQYRADGSTFFDTGALNHELKFGFGYRETPVRSVSGWPGDQFTVLYEGANTEGGTGGVYLSRRGDANYEMKYTDLYVGDTMLLGNLTIQAGLRYDLQKGTNGASTAKANPTIPDILSSFTFDSDDSIEWESIAPRIGATYALGSTRRTLLRASYNQYVDQLGAGGVSPLNPLGSYQYLYYYFTDVNGDNQAQRNEIQFEGGPYGNGVYGAYNVDPENPTSAVVLNRVDPNIKPPRTDEVVLGFEHELLPEFTVGLNYTHRNLTNFVEYRSEKTVGSNDFYTRADYEPFLLAGGAPVTGTLPDGTAYTVPVYQLKEGISPSPFSVLTNRPDYEQTYNGLELNLTKRMSNRWMMRGNVSFADWKQNVGAGASADPTHLRTAQGCSNCDGDIVVQGSGTGSGAKGGIYINAGWAYNVTGVYQLPFGINVGANLLGREGYVIPYIHRVSGPRDGAKNVLIGGVDDYRHDDVMNLDMRVGKEFRFPAGIGLTLSADVFNVTGENTVLQRNTRIYRTATALDATRNRISEIQSPRVFRFGARISF